MRSREEIEKDIGKITLGLDDRILFELLLDLRTILERAINDER